MGESDRAPNASEESAKEANVLLLEQKLQSLSSESAALLETENGLRRTIQRMTTEHSKYVYYIPQKRYNRYIAEKEAIIAEKHRIASELDITSNAKLEELESALISQAVEKDLCEESIASMERELDSKIDSLRRELAAAKTEEQETVDKLNSLLSHIKSKLENLELTITEF